MKDIFHDALLMIAMMEREKLPVKRFIHDHTELFDCVERRSLIPPECREKDGDSDTAFVFVIGSYIYQRAEGKPVTWFERRRTAEFRNYSELYSRTLCSFPKRRFQRIDDLKNYLVGVMQNEDAGRGRDHTAIV